MGHKGTVLLCALTACSAVNPAFDTGVEETGSEETTQGEVDSSAPLECDAIPEGEAFEVVVADGLGDVPCGEITTINAAVFRETPTVYRIECREECDPGCGVARELEFGNGPPNLPDTIDCALIVISRDDECDVDILSITAGGADSLFVQGGRAVTVLENIQAAIFGIELAEANLCDCPDCCDMLPGEYTLRWTAFGVTLGQGGSQVRPHNVTGQDFLVRNLESNVPGECEEPQIGWIVHPPPPGN